MNLVTGMRVKENPLNLVTKDAGELDLSGITLDQSADEHPDSEILCNIPHR